MPKRLREEKCKIETDLEHLLNEEAMDPRGDELFLTGARRSPDSGEQFGETEVQDGECCKLQKQLLLKLRDNK